MNRTAAIAAAVATFCAGLSSMWAFFWGAIIWAHGDGAVQALFGALFVAFFFLLSGIFVCNAIWPRTPRPSNPFDNAKVSNKIPYPKAGEGSTPPRPPRDFAITNDRGEGNFDRRDLP